MLRTLKTTIWKILFLPFLAIKKYWQAIFSPYLDRYTPLNIKEISSVNQLSQKLLMLKYKELLTSNSIRLSFADVGFRVFSQNDEDGILLYLFSILGTANKKCVEICAGDGIENNTANLILNHGWTGLLFDSSASNVTRGRDFYSSCKDTLIYPPLFIQTWVDAENVNNLIQDNGFRGEIDLLSLDLDGVDYWIWKSINCISPRVVVLEYQNIWGPELSVTVPYRRDFNRYDFHPQYWGASLASFVKLANEKG